jgi:hypothetical protein
VGWCRQRLLHYSYRSLDDFLRKVSRYSNWGAKDARRKGLHASGWRIFGHSAGHFLKSYVLKQGFRDGVAGLVVAFMEGYYGFFKYARLMEMQREQPPS